MATQTSTSPTAAQQHELENIRASWAIEGQFVTDHEMRVLERVARGRSFSSPAVTPGRRARDEM